jgi:hypothetical protein
MASKAVGQQFTYYSAIDEPVTINGPVYELTTSLANGVLILFVFYLLVYLIRKHRELQTANFVLFLAMATLFGFIMLGTAFSADPSISLGFVLVSVMVLILSLWRHSLESIVIGVASVTLTLTFTSAVFGLLGGSGAATACRADKCGLAGVLFSGVASHENSLGLFLVMAIPFLLGFRDRTLRYCAVSAVILVLFLSNSRSSLLTLAALAAAWLVFKVARGKGQNWRWAQIVVPIVGLALTPWLVLAGSSSGEDFTGRSSLWELARTAISDNFLSGMGMHGWVLVRDTTGAFGADASYSPHNQFLDLFLQGGIFAALGLVVVACILSTHALRGSLIALLYLTAFVWAGLLERPVSFGVPDWSTTALVAGVALMACGYGNAGVRIGQSDFSLGGVHPSPTQGSGQNQDEIRKLSSANADFLDLVKKGSP